MVSGIRIDLEDGSDTATLTATAMNQHAPPGRGAGADGPNSWLVQGTGLFS